VELTREQLVQKLRISPLELDEWIGSELIAPPDLRDLFPESALEEGEMIKKFSSLGYALKEIQKIKRSVGLPLKDEKGRYISKSEFLTIGELAERSGVNARTIKFWEEKGIVNPYRRTEGGFRLYRPEDVSLISFIKDLQTFNYTLSEIASILPLVGGDPTASEANLQELEEDEIEKLASSLDFLIGRMREVREASQRVESVFSRRLRSVARALRNRKRG
jgi:DNA-binding transcriptional MerR regulator